MSSRAIFSPEPAKGWLPWGALAPILCVLFVAAPALGGSSALEYFHLGDERGNPIGLAGLYAFLLFPFAVNGLLLWAWIHFVERRPLTTIGLVGEERARTFLHGLAIGAVTVFAVVAAVWVAGGYVAGGYGKAFGSASALLNMGFLLLCFVVQASVEEILFRGWLLSVIARKFNVVAGVILTSLVFMFLHYGPGQHWLAMLGTFLFSAFACAWALKAGNIWGVMGWHTGWNWLLSIGFELPVTGITVDLPALIVKLMPTGPASLTGGAEGPEASFLCSLFFVLGIAFLAWRRRPRSGAD